MVESLRISASLKPFFPELYVLLPGEHADLTVILQTDLRDWLQYAVDEIHPLVVPSAEAAWKFFQGMAAIQPRGPWPQEYVPNDDRASEADRDARLRRWTSES